MAVKKATFEVTCDSNGMGDDDVHLRVPSSLSRPIQLLAVQVDVSEAFSSKATISLTEVLNSGDSDETLGETVFHSSAARMNKGIVSVTSNEQKVDARDTALSVPSAGGGIQFIEAPDLRCEVYGGNSADVFTVVAYYETAGDYRF